MNKPRPPRISLIIAFSMAMLINGCNTQPQETKQFKGHREQVVLGVAFQVLSTPVIIADEKGYFRDEGLDVTIKQYEFGKLALEGMFAGAIRNIHGVLKAGRNIQS